MRLLFNLSLLAAAAALNAFAAGTGGLPWEAPLERIGDSITGPVAYGLTIGGIAVSGGTMMYHGDLGEFGKRAAQVVLVGSTCCFAGQIVTTTIGATGALL